MTTTILNLRLPSGLHAVVRAKSAGLGISINAMICVALADYLQYVAPPEPPPPAPESAKAKLTKAQRVALTAAARLARKQTAKKPGPELEKVPGH